MKRAQHSFLSKIIVGVSLAILVIEAILTVPTSWLYREELLQTRREFTRLFAHILTEHRLGEEIARDRARGLDHFQEEVESLRPSMDLHVFVFDAEGQLVATSWSRPLPDAVAQEARAAAAEAAKAGHAAAPGGDAERFVEADSGLYLIAPLRGDGAVASAAAPAGIVVVGSSIDDIHAKVLSHVLMTLGLTLVILLFTGLITIQTIHMFILKPIGHMVRANLAIYEGREAEAFIPEDAMPDDELGDVMRSRNQIYEKLLMSQRRVEEQNKVLLAQQAELTRWSEELARRVREKTEELERVHRRLLEADKMAAIGQLAAGVAHEINNPLASIAGYAEDLRELASRPGIRENPAFAEFERSLRVIEEQAYRCKSITRKLLTFARKEALRLEPFDVNDLVRETATLLERTGGDRDGPAVVLDLREGLPPLLSDRGRLQQVLLNLLENAVDACGADGQVVVRSVATGPHKLSVEVEDSGPGIPEELRCRIFEPFFTTKPVGRGTGLGLSICYGIVEDLRGRIEFESEIGRGTVFRVTLPTGDGAGTVEAAAAEPASNRRAG